MEKLILRINFSYGVSLLRKLTPLKLKGAKAPFNFITFYNYLYNIIIYY